MRTAIISDVHANLEALSAVLERVRELRVDEIVCLGDSVGYNANPNECLAMLRQEKVVCLLGNHDAVAAGIETPDRFNPLARAAVLWTQDHLTQENRQFFLELPREVRIRDFIAFHGSIYDTDRYILSRNDVIDNFRALAQLPGSPSFGFFGHTHVQAGWSLHQNILSSTMIPDVMSLLPDRHYLINPGSVGQPRDGDPRAAFLIYDDQERRVSFHRVEYDIRICQDKIIHAGLPPQLAERLTWGR